MERLLTYGALFVLKLVEASITEEVRRQEQAHKRLLAEQLLRERARILAGEAQRKEESRIALERAKQASTDPRWQQQIDLLLATKNPP